MQDVPPAPATVSGLPPSYEEHWPEATVREGLASGSLVLGKLHVPSFHTDTAYVITEVGKAPPSGLGSQDMASQAAEVWIPVTGFLGRNRAMHGDIVAATPLWAPWRAASGGAVPADAQEEPAAGADGEAAGWDRARCRVVAVLERQSAAREFVAVLQTPGETGKNTKVSTLRAAPAGPVGQTPLKVQPRDRRLPAFWLLEAEPKGLQQLPAGTDGADAKSRSRSRRRSKAQLAAFDARAGSLTREALLHAAAAGSNGVLCVVKYVDWPSTSLLPHANVLQVLGPLGSLAAESDALLSFYGLEWRPFSKEAEEHLRAAFPDARAVVEQALAAGRADMRHIRCFTVDPPTARDLDDAVSVAAGKAPGTFRVGVHVADVTHFVQPGDIVDAEARRRATTVYLVGKVYPMLPRWLSESLCSLLPDGDRLSMSVFFSLDVEGRLVEEDPPIIARGVIRTRARLSYQDVDRALESDQASAVMPADVLDDLQTLALLTGARRRLRINSGAVILERSHFFFRTNDEGQVEGIVREPSASVSHHLIEELMVLANHIVAAKLVEAGGSATFAAGQPTKQEAALPQPLLRRHPDTEDKVREKIFGLLPDHLASQAPQDKPLAVLLDWCRQHWSAESHEAVCADILTEFDAAEYIVADLGEEAEVAPVEHWALSLPLYMHFTSPIRRYADVLVHRRLANILESEGVEMHQGLGSPAADTHAVEHADFLNGLKQAVEVCNAKKRDAQDANLDSVQLALSAYIHSNGGMDVPDAVITRIVMPRTSEVAATAEGEELGEKPQTFWQRLKSRTMKEALEFYVPPAQCTRSVSFDALNIELASQPQGAAGEGSRPASASTTRSVWVRPKGGRGAIVELKVLEPLPVRLVSEGPQDSESTAGSIPRRWTVRLPWAAALEREDTVPVAGPKRRHAPRYRPDNVGTCP